MEKSIILRGFRILRLQDEKVGFDFIPGDKAKHVIENLLDKYSVSQIMNLTYRSIANVSSYYLEIRISKKHAANIVIRNLERLSDYANTNNWDITLYRRNFDLPESLLSGFLFDYLMEISSLGFLEKPTML